jgi:hypothetical protein
MHEVVDGASDQHFYFLMEVWNVQHAIDEEALEIQLSFVLSSICCC